jgi:acyl-CoA synthetase (NDP forming)
MNSTQPYRVVRRLLEAALARGEGALAEVDAKTAVAAYGVPVPAGGLARSADEAVALADDVGYPVVVKASSTRILHKSESGLVVLDLRDAASVRRAVDELAEKVAQQTGGPEAFEGVLVERMLARGREFVVGMSRDPQFGPVVMFGLGGVYAEALKDVAFGVAPLGVNEAEALLQDIRAGELLDAFRGAPPADRPALIAISQAVGRLALDHPEIYEVDLNPVLLEEGRPVAVDALITLGPPRGSTGERPYADTIRLDAAFHPKSIAVVGASNDPTKWGGAILTNLLSNGFEGAIYPVNPSDQEIFGLPAFPSIDDLPATPDLALMAVPARVLPDVIRQCGLRGVQAAVVVSAGFSEAGPEGAALERAMVDAAAESGLLLVGPNTIGLTSAGSHLCAMGVALLRLSPGGASFLSQSGNLGVQLLEEAGSRGIGVEKFIGLGNAAAVDTPDLMEYFRQDADTKVILAYIEGFQDGRRFMTTARRAAREKPVVVLRGGESSYGSRAAASHTGAMAVSQKVFEAVARQSGVITTTDPDEFLDLTVALAALPMPRGPRVAVVTMGGGWGVITADEVARSGLQLADLSPEVMAQLNDLLPPFWSHGNPIDLVATLREGVAEQAVEAVMRSERVDAVVVLAALSIMTYAAEIVVEASRLKGLDVFPDTKGYFERRDEFIRRLTGLMDQYHKPVLIVDTNPPEEPAALRTGARSWPVILPSPIRAVRVLAQMARYQAFLGRE